MTEEEFLKTILKAFREFYNYAGLHNAFIETYDGHSYTVLNRYGVKNHGKRNPITIITFEFVDPNHGYHRQELKLLRAMDLNVLEKVLKEEEYNARSTHKPG